MISWRDRGRGTTSLDGSGSSPSESDVVLPLGPGEWEEALGLPLCVVCQNVCENLRNSIRKMLTYPPVRQDGDPRAREGLERRRI